MQQQPLTSAGVQAKQNELYALSDPQLLDQANQIRNTFSTWVTENFTLDSTQQAFLNSIDPRWIAYTSQEAGFAVENRLPITFSQSGTGPGKLIRTHSNLECDYNNAGQFTASGSLAFTVVYS